MIRPFGYRTRAEVLDAARQHVVTARLTGGTARPLGHVSIPDILEDIAGRQPAGDQLRLIAALPAELDADKVLTFVCSRALARCVDYIGPGSESWRVTCRHAVREAARITRSGRWLTATEAELPARASRVCADSLAPAAGLHPAACAARAAISTSRTWDAWAGLAAEAAELHRSGQSTGAAKSAEHRAQFDDLLTVLQS